MDEEESKELTVNCPAIPSRNESTGGFSKCSTLFCRASRYFSALEFVILVGNVDVGFLEVVVMEVVGVEKREVGDEGEVGGEEGGFWKDRRVFNLERKRDFKFMQSERNGRGELN